MTVPPRNWLFTFSSPRRLGWSEAVMEAPADHAILDLRDLYERAGHDEDLVRDVLSELPSVAELTRRELEAALASSDRTMIGRVAHRAKGACATVGAERGRSLASHLELTAPSSSLDDLNEQARCLFEVMTEMERAVSQFMENTTR